MIFFDVGNGFFEGFEVFTPTIARHVIPSGPCANFILIVAATSDEQRIAMAVLFVMSENLMNNLPRFFSNI